MSTSYFDQGLPNWSARKHAILEKYLQAFCTALSASSRSKPIWYVDGYAGAGVYRDLANPNDSGNPGSPVLAAQVAANLRYNIRCLNVEENYDSFASLTRETLLFPHVTNIKGDFTQVIDQVLREIRDCPALFFLDSFGTKELPMDGVVDKIARRSQPTDILLRYATDAVRRLAGSYERDLIRRDANEVNLNRWFRGNLWQDIIQQYPAGPKRDELLLDYYKEQICSISSGRIKYAQYYPIQSIEGSVKYHMVFATGNLLGVKIMNDILYTLGKRFSDENETYQRSVQPYEQADMFAPPRPAPEIVLANHSQSIQDTIIEVGCQKPEWNFMDLYYELIINSNWFARLSEKDFRAACKKLHETGQIKRLTSGRAWDENTSFRIEPR